MSRNPKVLIPAAGKGERFRAIGITTPKPFIRMSFDGSLEKTMLEHAMRGTEGWEKIVGLPYDTPCPDSWDDLLNDDVRFVNMSRSTNGQADTVGLMNYLIHPSENPVLVLNSDTMFLYDLHTFVDQCAEFDAGVLVVQSNDPALSYVDNHGEFVMAREKFQLSPWAIAGAFYFRDTHVLSEAVRILHRSRLRGPNGETYLSDALNFIYNRKLAVSMPEELWVNMGTPEALWADRRFQGLPFSLEF